MSTLKHAFNAKDMNSLVYRIVEGKVGLIFLHMCDLFGNFSRKHMYNSVSLLSLILVGHFVREFRDIFELQAQTEVENSLIPVPSNRCGNDG